MATTTPTVGVNRSALATAAPVILVLSAVANFANVGGYFSGAPIPPVILTLEVILGLAALVAAYGLRGRRRWALTLALIVAVLSALLGLMGIVTAGSMTGKVVAAFGAVLALAALVLVAPQAARRTAD